MLRVLDQSVGLTLTSGIHLVVVFYTSSELYQIRCRSPICDSVCSIVVDLKSFTCYWLQLQRTMPGYGVNVVEPLKSTLTCPECKLLFRDAVQTESGILLCESCFKQILQ